MTKLKEPATQIVRPLVLVVDDDPSVLEALSSLLAPRLEPFYRVETAESAEDALKLLSSGDSRGRANPVALVISDEKMPGKSGVELLTALRQNLACRDGGRIIVTAYAALDSAERAINEAEVDRYYPKPWDAKGKLLPAVAEILERFETKQALNQFLVCATAESPEARRDVWRVRREWQAYLTLDETLDEAQDDTGLDDFKQTDDDESLLFLMRREGPQGSRPVASIRLHRVSGRDDGVLDALCFWPEDAGDDIETLLVQTALVDASQQGMKTVYTAAPILRRDVYEPLGFSETNLASAEAAALGEAPPGTVWMSISSEDIADQETAKPFLERYAQERRLCACVQTDCPAHDYNAPRRGHFCPLDLHEGRAPLDFPRSDSGRSTNP